MVRAAIPEVGQHEFHSLNERFYRLAPYEYLDLRIQSLILTASDDVQEALGELLARGFSYKNLRATGEPLTRTALDRYAAVESTVLLHHASEALLRLYLAHANRTPCPWLALSSILSPSEFKKRVRELRDELDRPDRVDDLLEVFSYTSNRSNFEGVSEEAWLSHRDGLVRLVRHLIDEVLDDAHVYNAAKHGLAIGAGDLGLRFGSEGKEPLFDRNGPALDYLELSGPPADRHWLLTSKFINPTKNIAVVILVSGQIKSLWKVAKTMRHIQPQSESFSLLSHATVQEILDRDQKTGFTPKGFSERLHAPGE